MSSYLYVYFDYVNIGIRIGMDLRIFERWKPKQKTIPKQNGHEL